MIQAKVLPKLLAAQRGTPLFQARFGQVMVFQIVNMFLNEFDDMIRLGPARTRRQIGQPAFHFVAQADRHHKGYLFISRVEKAGHLPGGWTR